MFWILAMLGCAAEPGGYPVLQGWVDRPASKPLPPYFLEDHAAAIVVGVVGEARGQVLPIEVREVLAGDDVAPVFGCLVPDSVPRPSERFPFGTEVLVFLQQAGPGLGVLAIVPASASEGTRRYLALRDALGTQGWPTQVGDELDELETEALRHTDAVGEVRVLSGLLGRGAEQLEAGEAPDWTTLRRALSLVEPEPEVLALQLRLLTALAAADDALVAAGWPTLAPPWPLDGVAEEDAGAWAGALGAVARRTAPDGWPTAAHPLGTLATDAAVDVILSGVAEGHAGAVGAARTWLRTHPDSTARPRVEAALAAVAP